MAFVVRQGSVTNDGVFVVAFEDFVAEFRVRTFLFVIEGLTNVMQEATTTAKLGIHAQIGSHCTSQEPDFHRVLQDVLAVRRPVLQFAQGLDHLWMQSRYFASKGCFFAVTDDFAVHVLLHLGQDLFDAGGVNAAIGQQFFHDPPRDLATHTIKTANGDLARGVVDDHVNTSRLLEGPDVAAFFADDPAFEFFFGDGDAADGGLGGVFSGIALHGTGDDFGCFFFGAGLGFFRPLGDQAALFIGQLFVQAREELLLRFFGAEAGDFFQFVCRAGLAVRVPPPDR